MTKEGRDGKRRGFRELGARGSSHPFPASPEGHAGSNSSGGGTRGEQATRGPKAGNQTVHRHKNANPRVSFR